MGLNPHLINLMSLREQQRLQVTTSTPRLPSSGETSFAETLEESLAAAQTPPHPEGGNLSEARRFLDLQALRQTSSLPNLSTVNPQRLQQRYVGEFAAEHALVLAAQQTPATRYRTNPDDDTSGETETAANLRPIR